MPVGFDSGPKVELSHCRVLQVCTTYNVRNFTQRNLQPIFKTFKCRTGFPTGWDCATFRNNRTEVPLLSRDKGTSSKSCHGTGLVGRASQNLGRDVGRDRVPIFCQGMDKDGILNIPGQPRDRREKRVRKKQKSYFSLFFTFFSTFFLTEEFVP